MVAQKAELRLRIQKLETLYDAIEDAKLEAGSAVPADTAAKLRQCLSVLYSTRWNIIWQLCDLEREHPHVSRSETVQFALANVHHDMEEVKS